MVNYSQMQAIVHRQIKNFGGGEQNAVLRRNGQDRECTVVVLRDIRQEREGSLVQFGDKVILVSPVGLDDPPDPEAGDTLVFRDVEYRIVSPAEPLAPDGETVLYWQIIARK